MRNLFFYFFFGLAACSLPPATSFAGQEQNKPLLLLYYSPTCPYCQEVLKYLDSIHKKVSLIDIKRDPQSQKELVEYGGKSQVPCLFIDGTPLYESEEIIRWLSRHKNLLEDV